MSCLSLLLPQDSEFLDRLWGSNRGMSRAKGVTHAQQEAGCFAVNVTDLFECPQHLTHHQLDKGLIESHRMGSYFGTLRLESPLEEDGRNSASQVDS